MEFTLQHGAAWAYTGGKPFDPAQPVCVFIHGAQNDHSVWALQSRFFAHQGFAVLAPDLPAHGRGSGMALHSIEALADWLLALLQAAQIKQAHLIGHSMGSLIALEAAARSPVVTRLSLVGTAFPMQVAPALLQTAQSDQMAALAMVNPWAYASHAPKPSCPGPGFYAPGMGLALKQRVARVSAARTPAGSNLFYLDFCACNAYANGLQAAHTLAARATPVQFVIARQDMMTPEKATHSLRAALPAARLDYISPAGHDMMAEQPEQVRRALWEFAST
ncbi:alpha/beta hydrolase [Massilia sp. W12]|uniref:alpha/beta fold hydrolase n=1 Tax=Massilia sp. W12 TaxID=3126507 RepID=UPI0030D59D03